MCQSKAEGGIRCSSHAIAALQAHADKQVDMVKAYAAEKGITLQDESKMYNSFEHSTSVYAKVHEKKAYIKAENAFVDAQKNESELEFQLTSVAAHKNPTSVSQFLWQRSEKAKELTALRDKAWEDNDNVAAEKHIAMLKGLRAKTAAEATNIVNIVNERGAHNLVKTLKEQNTTPGYLADAQRSAAFEKKSFLKVRSELFEVEKHRFVSKKFRNTQEFKDVAKSVDFRKRPEVREWQAKQDDLQKDYSMTSDYREKLENIASFHPEGSDERVKIETLLRKSEILKQWEISRNKREAGVLV
jgi:hypothetical protein